VNLWLGAAAATLALLLVVSVLNGYTGLAVLQGAGLLIVVYRMVALRTRGSARGARAALGRDSMARRYRRVAIGAALIGLVPGGASRARTPHAWRQARRGGWTRA
jgi:hypothetical protein